MKIYTRSGDEGKTGLLGSQRIPKHHLRIQAYGTVDELNAVLGLVRSYKVDIDLDSILAQVQDELFIVGSALADPNPDGSFFHLVKRTHVERLELTIDTLESELQPLNKFILPGGTNAAASLHLARTVCRRAERSVVELCHAEGEQVGDSIVPYLNRLSDLLFVAGRLANQRAGVTDIPWSGLTNPG